VRVDDLAACRDRDELSDASPAIIGDADRHAAIFRGMLGADWRQPDHGRRRVRVHPR